VLAEPGAAVYLTDAKNGVLELTALAYVASPRQAFSAKSELLFEIVEDLQTRGMALSSTSPVLNLGTADVRPRPARGGLRAGMFRGP